VREQSFKSRGMKAYYQDKWVTIYHGDCREILPQLDVKVDLVLTDPPYGINYQSNYRSVKFARLAGDDKLSFEWLRKATLTENGSFYVFANEVSLDDTRQSIRQIGFNTLRLLVWDKGSTTAGNLDDYASRCEFIVYSKRKYAKLRGSRDSNLISIPRVHPTVLQHPTEKPEMLISYLIMKSTDYEETILDPFLGSGTTCFCAKKLNRYSIGIEIEERYCEIAAKRCCQEVMELKD